MKNMKESWIITNKIGELHFLIRKIGKHESQLTLINKYIELTKRLLTDEFDDQGITGIDINITVTHETLPKSLKGGD